MIGRRLDEACIGLNVKIIDGDRKAEQRYILTGAGQDEARGWHKMLKVAS